MSRTLPAMPERTQNPPARTHRTLLSAFLVILLLWPYAASLSDGGMGVTVVNRTKYFIHVIINNKQFVYIAPGSVLTYELETFADAIVRVTYSPGQGVRGEGEKTFQPVRQDVSAETNDCSNHNNGGCVQTTSSTSTISPVRWEVIPSDLSSN